MTCYQQIQTQHFSRNLCHKFACLFFQGAQDKAKSMIVLFESGNRAEKIAKNPGISWATCYHYLAVSPIFYLKNEMSGYYYFTRNILFH